MPITQSQRMFALATAAGEDALLLRRLRLEEGISRAFHVVLEAESERLDLAPTDLLGTGACVFVQLADGTRRPFHGLVTSFERRGRTARIGHYRLELRPTLWLLSRRTNCRIFQNLSVPQIVSEVLQNAGLRDFDLRLAATYPMRDYCVQYRETDHDFVLRLLEEEGIFFYFEHEASRHVLVLTDTPVNAPLCPGQDAFDYHALDDGTFGRDTVREFVVRDSIEAGAIALKDYSFLDPNNHLHVQVRGKAGNPNLELYDHHPGEYGVQAAGTRLAKLRMQEQEVAAVRALGRGDGRSFLSGHRFTLRAHPHPELDGKQFLLVAVHHELEQPSAFSTLGGEDTTTYENSFECVPAELPYRAPNVTPRPHIGGPQTAVVTGPKGEEIHVDQFGRIKVRFHWDRLGKGDENSSCWVRVAQVWAGKQWGGLVHPRIGDEVIVEFLEGDPDRPIVTGSVYNARQMPPYALPANKTQSGFKTRSTPEGTPQNFNELRFEDKKGQEQVFLQAEKDLQFTIKNDRSGSVGHNESLTVGGNRTASVAGNETVSVGGDRTASVGGNETTQIGGNEALSVGSNSTEQVGALKLIDAGAAVLIKAGTSITLQCGASTLHMNQAGFITLSGMVINIAAAVNANMAAPITNVVGAVMSTNTGAVNVVTGGVVARVTGAQVETLASGDNVVRGGKVKINT